MSWLETPLKQIPGCYYFTVGMGTQIIWRLEAIVCLGQCFRLRDPGEEVRLRGSLA